LVVDHTERILSWSEWFPLAARSTTQSLVGIGLVVFGLSWLALWIPKESRRCFSWGLFAAVVAYLVQIAVPFPLVFFGIRLGLLLALMIAPFVEETARVSTAVLSPVFVSGRFWKSGLWYALGYASLESTAKLFDAAVSVSQGRFVPWDWALAGLAAPPVVFALHLTLGLVMACLLAARWRPLPIMLVTFSIHLAHNASVYWSMSATSYSTTIVLDCARLAIFAFVISRCVFFLRGADERYKALQ
jgi:hypothetical protein